MLDMLLALECLSLLDDQDTLETLLV